MVSEFVFNEYSVCVLMSIGVSYAFPLAFYSCLFCTILDCLLLFYYYLDARLYSERERTWKGVYLGGCVRR